MNTATTLKTSPKCDWNSILQQAGAIVRGYETPVTLRQLFYRLVSIGLLSNTQTTYKCLSSRTAEARRRGEFPALIDRTRTIHRYQTFTSVDQARGWLADIYRRDRTEGQAFSIYIGVEKNGIVEQLNDWFGGIGVPIVALGGYSSQTYIDEIRRDVCLRGRPAVLVYSGDFDPSGEDIERDFVERTGCFDVVQRVALTTDQVEHFQLPPQPGKATDARAAKFIARHSRLVQVELDALPPEILKQLYEQAIAKFWGKSALEVALAQERDERTNLEPERRI